MTELIIHFGMGKSASTTIQRSVLGDPSAPQSIGRHKTAEMQALGLEPMWWRGLVAPPGHPNVETALAHLKRHYLDHYPKVVLSDEVISASPILLDNLLRSLTDLRKAVRFLFITRQQTLFLASFYNHSMRSRVNAFGLPLLHSVVSNRFQYSGDINCWAEDLIEAFKKGDINILNALCYDRVVGKLRAFTQTSNSVVLPFELLNNNRDIFAHKIAKLFGMAPDRVMNLLDDKQNVTGHRLQDYLFGESFEKLLKHKSISGLKKMGFTKKQFNALLLPILSTVSTQKKQSLDEKTLLKLVDCFIESNKALDTMLPYDLSEFNYLKAAPLSSK